jgi:chloride channel 3/4/5
MICYFNTFLRIDMTESMEILFRECEGGHDYHGLCRYTSPLWCIDGSDGTDKDRLY